MSYPGYHNDGIPTEWRGDHNLRRIYDIDIGIYIFTIYDRVEVSFYEKFRGTQVELTIYDLDKKIDLGKLTVTRPGSHTNLVDQVDSIWVPQVKDWLTRHAL